MSSVFRKLKISLGFIAAETARPGETVEARAQAQSREYFDGAHYRSQDPARIMPGDDALLHFLRVGWRLGLNPAPWFDVRFYLETYPDVAAAGLNPFLHYIEFGRSEGRLTRADEPKPDTPSGNAAVPSVEQPSVEELEEARALTSGHFDEAHYLGQNPDLTRAGGDALLHFLAWGWREGLDPSPDCDVAFYLEASPDVTASGQNPLLHFLRHGAEEGRLPRRSVNLWRDELARGWTNRGRLANAPPRARSELIELPQLIMRLKEIAAGRRVALVLSHDDYTKATGGVQNVVGDEQVALQAEGWAHMHISPMHSQLRLADLVGLGEAEVRIRLEGQLFGVMRMADVVTAVRGMARDGGVVQVIIHHLAGFAPEHVSALIGGAGRTRAVVWVHDFFSLCASHALMRNNIAYCGAPPIHSMGCTICVYGPERPEHVRRLRNFFAQVRPDVIAPSAFALEIWQRSRFEHNRSAIVPLARLELTPGEPSSPHRSPVRVIETGARQAIRVAHLGAPSLIKGWDAFERLAERYKKDGRYAFFQLGVQNAATAPDGLHRVAVEVQVQDRSAMVRAVREHAIDIVICWSACSETFCFTAHEALAGGAFVIARRDAGNIWRAVEANAPDQGIALETEADLLGLFAGDGLLPLLSRPRRHGRLVPGRGAMDWLDPQASALTSDLEAANG